MKTVVSAAPPPPGGSPAPRPLTSTTRLLLGCGVIAGPLFVATFLVQGAIRDHYDPLRHPVSSLALGSVGWVQTANFIVTGMLLLAFAAGLRPSLRHLGGRVLVPLLVGAVAVGLVGAGIFVTDPVGGYPPGTPDVLPQPTAHGAAHDLLSVPTFVGWPIACFVLAVRFGRSGRPGWAVYSVVTGIVFVGMFVLSTMGFAQVAPLDAYGGLFQRITVVAGFAWITLLAVRLRAGGFDARKV